MTTVTAPVSAPPLAFVDEPMTLYRLSVEQYHEMIDREIIREEDRCELLEGILVQDMSIDEPHVFVVKAVERLIEKLLNPTTHNYRNQGPLTLADGEPVPDGAVVLGDDRRFLREKRKPAAADALLVIEVADATLRRDRGIKHRSYARAGIAVYWIVNLIDRQIEVHTDPASSADEATYKSVKVYRAADRVPVTIAGQVVGEIAVADVLP